MRSHSCICLQLNIESSLIHKNIWVWIYNKHVKLPVQNMHWRPAILNTVLMVSLGSVETEYHKILVKCDSKKINCRLGCCAV
jgi:hypothetical protein